MRTTQSRLAAIEAKLTPNSPRRVYVVIGGGPENDPAAFVREQGYEFDDDQDLIVHRVGYVPSPNGPVRMTGPMGWIGNPGSRAA